MQAYRTAKTMDAFYNCSCVNDLSIPSNFSLDDVFNMTVVIEDRVRIVRLLKFTMSVGAITMNSLSVSERSL